MIPIQVNMNISIEKMLKLDTTKIPDITGDIEAISLKQEDIRAKNLIMRDAITYT